VGHVAVLPDRVVIARHPIVLVRHGETEWSAADRHTGRTDVPLTELGRRQAEALAGMLRGPFTLVLSSPLARASETMKLAGLDGELDADLVEWDYGDLEGMTTAEIRTKLPGWTIWSGVVPHGEELGDVARRADRVLTRSLAADGPVVMFSHGHFLRVLAARWLGEAAPGGRQLALDTASVSELGWEREARVIRHWNELCHLRPIERE
jgi:probable phosphoglycerate mutase